MNPLKSLTMVKCIVGNCPSRTELHVPNITFHRFPKQEERRKIWINGLNLIDNQVKVNHLVCSQHFEESCYYNTKKGRRLSATAYPTKLLTGTAADIDSEQTTSADDMFGEGSISESPELTESADHQPTAETSANDQQQDSLSSESDEDESSSSDESSSPQDSPKEKSNRAVANSTNTNVDSFERFRKSLYIQKLKTRLNHVKVRNLQKTQKISYLKYKVNKYKSKCQILQCQMQRSAYNQSNSFAYYLSAYCAPPGSTY